MAKYSQTVEYNLRTTLDDSGIARLQSEIRQVQNGIRQLSTMNLLGDTQVAKATKQLDGLSEALKKSYNANLGMLDTRKFAGQVKSLGLSMKELNSAFSMTGMQGQRSFVDLVGRLGKIDTGIQSVSKTTDKLFNTLGNTVRWGVISSGFQTVMNSAHQAVQYMRDLDASLTNIMLVSDYTKDDMREFARYANEAAAALGNTTVAYTDAALIYAQQGYGLEDQKKLADLTLKVSNVTGQESSAVSDQITAVVNGYQLSVQEATTAFDKLAEVANVSAADVEELAKAEAKVASTANTLGISQDQLAGQIATIISVTREAPENVGNALKTIYARLGDLKMGETLEDGTSLGNLSGLLDRIGIKVLDSTGEMRNMGDVMEDLMSQWDTFDRGTQQSLASTLAGKYQMNRFMTLMENAKMYNEYVKASEESAGTLEEMQGEYLDSLQGKISTLQATFEGFLSSLFNQDDFGGFIEGLTTIVSLFDDLINAVGGGGAALSGFGAILTNVFSNQISRGLNNFAFNRQNEATRKSNAKHSVGMLAAMGLDDAFSDRHQDLRRFAEENLQKQGIMSKEQQEAYNAQMEKTIQGRKNLISIEEELEAAVDRTNKAYIKAGYDRDLITTQRDANGALEVDDSLLAENLIDPDFKLTETQLEKMGGLSEYRGKLRGIARSFSKMQEEVLAVAGGADPDKFFDEYFDNAIGRSEDLIDSLALAENRTESIRSLLDEDRVLEVLGDGGVEDLHRYAGELQEIVNYANKLSENLAKVEISTDEDIEKLKTAYSSALAADEYNREKNNQWVERLSSQERIDNIVSMASSIGELAFAWQGFQSLGDLWANTEASEGEKIWSTVQNLLFTLPVLISSFAELKRVAESGSLFKSAEALSQLGDKSLKNGAAKSLENFSIASIAAGTAAKVGSKGVSILGAALEGLAGPVGIAVSLLAMVVSAINAADKAARQQAITSGFQEYTKVKDMSTVDTTGFDAAYEKYRKTGEVSDELKISSEELVSALNLVGGEALIEANRFDLLASRIETTSQKAKTAAQDFAEAQISALGDEVKQYHLFDTEDFAHQILGSENEKARELANIEQSFDGTIKKVNGKEDFAITDLVHGLNNALDETKNKIESLQAQQKSFDEGSSAYQEIQNKLTEQEELKRKLTTWLGRDEFQQTSQMLKEQADAEFKNLDFSQFTNKSKENIIAALTSGGEGLSFISEYIRSLGEKDGQAYIDSLYQAIATANPSVGAEDAIMGLTQYSNIYAKNQGKNTEAADAFADDVYAKLKDANFDDKDIIELKAKINAQDFVDNIDQIINDYNSGVYGVEDIILKYQPKVDISNLENASEIQQELSEQDISSSYFDQYKESAIAANEQFKALQDSVDELENKIRKAERAKAGLEEGSQSFKDAEEEIKNLSNELEYNEKVLNNLVKDQLLVEKGSEDLAKSFDNFVDVISNSSEGSKQYLDAINDILPALSNFLGVDFSSWGQDAINAFVSSRDNLDLLQQALMGSVDAWNALRQEAASQILINAGIDSTSLDSDLAWLYNWIMSASEMLPDIEAGASLDNTEFIIRLNEMVQSAQLSAAEMQAIFAALETLGVHCEVEYDSVSVELPSLSGGNVNKAMDRDALLKDSMQMENMPLYNISYQPKQLKVPRIVSKATGAASPGSGSLGAGGYKPQGGGGGGGGGGKGGGGGGGGGGPAYEPQSKEKLEEEYNRYQKIDAALDSIAADFEKIANEQDRLTGYKFANNLNKQVKLLTKQIELQKEKLAIQREEAQELRNRLSSEFGVVFDDEGFIQNYKERYFQLFNEVNSLIDTYNATATEEGQKTLDEQINQKQEAFDKFSELIEKYDDLQHNSIKSSLQEIEDYYDQIEDLRIEAFQKSVEAAEGLKEINELWIDFTHIGKGNTDDPFRAAATTIEKLAGYFDLADKSANEYYDNLIKRQQEIWASTNDPVEKENAHLRAEFYRAQKAKADKGEFFGTTGTGYFDMAFQDLEKINEQISQMVSTGTSSIFGENNAALYENARDIFESTIDLMTEYEELVEDLQESIIDAIEEMADEAEDRLNIYESVSDELEHQYNLVEMIHGDKAYGQMNDILDAQQHNYKGQIVEMQQTIAVWKELLNGLEKGSEQWKALNEQIIDAQSELNDLVETAIENLRQQYENTVNKVLDDWTGKIFGNDLEWVGEEWELINRNADQYLDSVNAAYNIQKLQNKYTEMLDKSNDLHIQQKISEQMKEQLEYLREKDKLSQYDVDYANAQLEILQKQIALEEAQRNKSQMKLRRDTQGNYSYVYTANEEDVLGAENDLLDAKNNAYNLSKEQIQQTQENSLSAIQNAKDMLNKIWTDANLSLEEKTKRTQTIVDNLKEYLKGTSEQLSTAEKNIINDFIGMCDILVGENKGNLEDIYNEIVSGNTDAFDQIDDRWSTSLSEWLQNMDEYESATDDMFNDLINAAEDYENNIDNVAGLVGQDFDNMGESIQDCVDRTDELTGSTSDFINELKVGGVEILGWQGKLTDYQAQLTNMTNETNKLKQALENLRNELADEQEKNRVLEDQLTNITTGNNGNGSGGSGSGGGGASDELAWGIAKNIWTYGVAGGWGNDPLRSSKLTDNYGMDFARKVQSIINENYASGSLVDYGSDKYSSYNLIGYDTGGYTGSWSDGNLAANNGKLAFLHQKELVLNETDTLNILKAVNAIRGMTENLKSGAFDAVISRLNQEGSGLINPDNNEQSLKQDIHIDASFPNVRDARDIEQAILNIADQATQYIHRRSF